MSRILVSERGVAVRYGVHAGKCGLANALVLDETGACVSVVVEDNESEEEFGVPPSALEVTGDLDPDFELQAIDDENGPKFLCRWMATLMTEQESLFYEKEGYTWQVVHGSHAGSHGGFRVVEWEPTWEVVQPSPDALAAWRQRKRVLAKAARTPTPAEAPKRPRVDEDTVRTVEKPMAAAETASRSPREELRSLRALRAKLKRPELKNDELKVLLAASHDDVDAAVAVFEQQQIAHEIARPSAAPPPSPSAAAPASLAAIDVTAGSMAAYGAICTNFKPHLVFALATEVRSSPSLKAIFGGHAGCARAIDEQPRFLWLSVMSDKMHVLLAGRPTDATVDAYPGAAIDCIHPSRRGSSKVAAFEGTATLTTSWLPSNAAAYERFIRSGVEPLLLKVQMQAPSAELAARCRRTWAPSLPYKVDAPPVGMGNITLEITHGHAQPYLTNASSARPNTPRCKIVVRLVDGTGPQSMLARAGQAALQVCDTADQMQNGRA